MKELFLIFSSSLLFASSLLGSELSSEPTSSSLIVYNAGIGLVNEQRNLKIDKDDKQIIYEDVASSIETDSVNITLPSSIKLLSQQYRFGELTLNQLVNANIGKKVIAKNEEVTLLSHSGSFVLVKNSKNEVIPLLNAEITFKNIPDSFTMKPSLVLNIDAKSSLKTNMQMQYLVKNISWKSNYILNVHDKKADLSGWITISNNSGKEYKNTQLHVLAGNINTVRNFQPAARYNKVSSDVARIGTTNISPQAYNDYYFYSIPFKVDIANNEKTQIKFMDKSSIPIVYKYTSIMDDPFYLNAEINHDVVQSLKIDKLDFPLPKGTIRTYSKLNKLTVLLGETFLDHTAKNTPIIVTIGSSFGVKVKETLQERDDAGMYLSSTVLYSLKNNSDEKKTIELIVPFTKSSKSSVETSHDYTYEKGNQLSFKVNLNSKETKTILVKFRKKR